MVEAILVIPFPLVARGPPTACIWFWPVQSFGLAFGCVHARHHQGDVVVGLTLDVLPFLMTYDG